MDDREWEMALGGMSRAAKWVMSPVISFVAPVIDTISRREERELAAELERWIGERVIRSIVFSYPKSYPASKPCPERVAVKGDGWRAVFVEKGLSLSGDVPDDLILLLRRLEQEHILNLQNLLRFLCEHSRKVRSEVAGFEASSIVPGYALPGERSTEGSSLAAARGDGFDPDFKWEAVKILPV
jgi:hypothetical protein